VQVCTSLQTDNYTSTPPLSFLQAGCPSCHPANSVKALIQQLKIIEMDLAEVFVVVQVMSKFVDLQESRETSDRQVGSSDSDEDVDQVSADVDELLRSVDDVGGSSNRSVVMGNTQRPLTPILIISHPLSTSSIYYHLLVQFACLTVHFHNLPWSSLVFLLVLGSLHHTAYISSPSHHHLFATRAHTIAACSAVIPMLCHLFPVHYINGKIHLNPYARPN